VRFCVFLENDKTDLRQFFFSEFRRKHLFITIYIENHYTQPLSLPVRMETKLQIVDVAPKVVSAPGISWLPQPPTLCIFQRYWQIHKLLCEN